MGSGWVGTVCVGAVNGGHVTCYILSRSTHGHKRRGTGPGTVNIFFQTILPTLYIDQNSYYKSMVQIASVASLLTEMMEENDHLIYSLNFKLKIVLTFF